MVVVNYEDAKAKLSDLIEAAMRGDKVVITKNGQQVIQLVPMKPVHRHRKFGSAKGKIIIAKDFDEPLEDFREYMP